MDPGVKRTAQQRADRIAAFRAELAELEREGGLTLTPEQRARLDAHYEGVLSALTRQYGVDVTESAKRISWGMRLATLLGGVALFAALVLFLHRVWGVVPPVVQVALLVVIPLIFLAAAEWSFRQRVDRYYTGLLALAAGASFVMELNALGAIYNVSSSPHAFLAWAMFAILVAYAYGLRLLLGAGLLLLCAYTAALWIAASGGYWASIPDRAGSLLPAAAILYVFPSLKIHRDSDDFGIVYRLCGAATMLVALLVMSERADLYWLGLPASARETLCQLAGLALSAGVTFHGFRLARNGLVNLGAAGFVVFLFVRLYEWWWNWMPKYLFFLLIAMIAFLLVWLFRRIHLRLAQGRIS